MEVCRCRFARVDPGVCFAFLPGRVRVLREIRPGCPVRMKRFRYAGISRGFVTASNALEFESSRLLRRRLIITAVIIKTECPVIRRHVAYVVAISTAISFSFQFSLLLSSFLLYFQRIVLSPVFFDLLEISSFLRGFLSPLLAFFSVFFQVSFPSSLFSALSSFHV